MYAMCCSEDQVRSPKAEMLGRRSTGRIQIIPVPVVAPSSLPFPSFQSQQWDGSNAFATSKQTASRLPAAEEETYIPPTSKGIAAQHASNPAFGPCPRRDIMLYK